MYDREKQTSKSAGYSLDWLSTTLIVIIILILFAMIIYYDHGPQIISDLEFREALHPYVKW